MLNADRIMKYTELKGNPSNPRYLKDDRFKKLKKSIEDFPEMLALRPIVIDEDNMVLGGNMRLKAIESLVAEGKTQFEDVPVTIAKGLTDEQKKEFIIKDNVGFGEWDWDILANEWDTELLSEWGLTVPEMGQEDYSRGITIPTYETSNIKPQASILVDKTKTDKLLEDIEASKLEDEDKNILRMAAQRHLIFDYSKIADYYAHSSPEMQKLMEDSALVIIDFNRAVELGYVKLTNDIAESFSDDYES